MRATPKQRTPSELARLRRRQRWTLHERRTPPPRPRGHMARGSGR